MAAKFSWRQWLYACWANDWDGTDWSQPRNSKVCRKPKYTRFAMPLADCPTDYRYGEYYYPSLGQRTLTHGPGPHPFAPQNWRSRLFNATHFTGHDFIFCWGILIGYGLTLQFGEMASIIGFVIFVPSYYFAVQRIGVLIILK